MDNNDNNALANKIQVYVQDLKFGMYVFALDRPWIETPFLFQGFLIEDTDQIDMLNKYCEYVYVDKDRSKVLITSNQMPIRKKINPEKKKPRVRFTPRKFSEHRFRESLVRSNRVYKDARGWIDTMLADARIGNSVDTDQARKLVTQLADEVIKNPDALVWLTHLRTRDEYTATHCVNVAILALTFGRSLGLEEKALHQVGLGALLHDVGKMKIPDGILNKPGRLTKGEFEIIKGHPRHGHKMVEHDENLDSAVLDIVLHHHERLDGGGYPKGLVDYQIDPSVRITSIVDVYDAITSDRCYHDGVTPAKAMENLFAWSEGNFDYNLLQSFIKCLGIYPIGTVVKLSSGESGVVVATDEERRLQPVVLLVLNARGEPYEPRRLVNMSGATWNGREMKIEQVLMPGALGMDIKSILVNELALPEHQVSAV